MRSRSRRSPLLAKAPPPVSLLAQNTATCSGTRCADQRSGQPGTSLPCQTAIPILVPVSNLVVTWNAPPVQRHGSCRRLCRAVTESAIPDNPATPEDDPTTATGWKNVTALTPDQTQRGLLSSLNTMVALESGKSYDVRVQATNDPDPDDAQHRPDWLVYGRYPLRGPPATLPAVTVAATDIIGGHQWLHITCVMAHPPVTVAATSPTTS